MFLLDESDELPEFLQESWDFILAVTEPLSCLHSTARMPFLAQHWAFTVPSAKWRRR
jgi:hypothetical protein